MCACVDYLSPSEGKRIQAILRHGKNRTSIRRAQVILMSAQGMKVHQIAQATYLHPEYVRTLIRRFKTERLNLFTEGARSGRPIEFSEEVRAEIVECALSPPKLLRLPFSRWSLEKLREYLVKVRVVKTISLETLRTILNGEGVHLQRTKTWKESNDPRFESKKNG